MLKCFRKAIDKGYGIILANLNKNAISMRDGKQRLPIPARPARRSAWTRSGTHHLTLGQARCAGQVPAVGVPRVSALHFSPGQFVAVGGTSKGNGFQCVMIMSAPWTRRRIWPRPTPSRTQTRAASTSTASARTAVYAQLSDSTSMQIDIKGISWKGMEDSKGLTPKLVFIMKVFEYMSTAIFSHENIHLKIINTYEI
ncbi:hypothetical protein PF011_g10833 [Phytophthora fragariae]|uniref:Uncharacterized protein n=2 Tax=Phytophthora fragariae TaxID=53985 RepID=A0A6A3KWL5_9STRA|nr:hypothetical protein PF011_g10833 [Phytophthora fragariae]